MTKIFYIDGDEGFIIENLHNDAYYQEQTLKAEVVTTVPTVAHIFLDPIYDNLVKWCRDKRTPRTVAVKNWKRVGRDRRSSVVIEKYYDAHNVQIGNVKWNDNCFLTFNFRTKTEHQIVECLL